MACTLTGIHEGGSKIVNPLLIAWYPHYSRVHTSGLFSVRQAVPMPCVRLACQWVWTVPYDNNIVNGVGYIARQSRGFGVSQRKRKYFLPHNLEWSLLRLLWAYVAITARTQNTEHADLVLHNMNINDLIHIHNKLPQKRKFWLFNMVDTF